MTIYAFTESAGPNPGFISISERGGLIAISVRSPAKDGQMGAYASMSVTWDQAREIAAAVAAAGRKVESL